MVKDKTLGWVRKDTLFWESWNMKQIQKLNQSFIPLLKLLESSFGSGKNWGREKLSNLSESQVLGPGLKI